MVSTHFAREIRRRYENPIAETTGTGKEVVLNLPETAMVNATITQEDIREGERVKAYRIEANTGGQWEVVKTLEPTISIGHKKIDKFARPIKTSALKLVVSEAIGETVIQNFRAFKI